MPASSVKLCSNPKKTKKRFAPGKGLIWGIFILLINAHVVFADRIILSELDFSPTPDKAKLIKVWELTHPSDLFGGLSGMVLKKDRFLFLSDEATLFHAQAKFNSNGILSGLIIDKIQSLEDDQGTLTGRDLDQDSESLSYDPQGNLFIAFERNNRVYELNPKEGRVLRDQNLPTSVQNFQHNKGIEALEHSLDGTLIAIEEGNHRTNGSGVYVKKPAQSNWRETRMAYLDEFYPTGLAKIPGRNSLILLERFFKGPMELRGRLYLFDPLTVSRTELIAEFRAPNPVDNFEAIAVRKAPDGGYHLFVLTDDNFNFIQRTLLFQLHYQP